MSSGMCRRRYVSVIGWLSLVGLVDTRLVGARVTEVGVAGWAWSLHGKQTRIGNCK